MKFKTIGAIAATLVVTACAQQTEMEHKLTPAQLDALFKLIAPIVLEDQ